MPKSFERGSVQCIELISLLRQLCNLFFEEQYTRLPSGAHIGEQKSRLLH